MDLNNHADLPPHAQRMVEEKSQLDEKLGKLTGFIKAPGFRNLSDKAQELLTAQAGAMSEYSSLLAERLVLEGFNE